MGPVQSVIIDTLNVAFVGAYIDVTNESHMHSVPAGSESHFKVVVIRQIPTKKLKPDIPFQTPREDFPLLRAPCHL